MIVFFQVCSQTVCGMPMAVIIVLLFCIYNPQDGFLSNESGWNLYGTQIACWNAWIRWELHFFF